MTYETPLTRVPLPAGRHRVSLDNPETRAHAEIDVVIRAGEHVERIVDLVAP